jgi:hypothetical protein
MKPPQTRPRSQPGRMGKLTADQRRGVPSVPVACYARSLASHPRASRWVTCSEFGVAPPALPPKKVCACGGRSGWPCRLRREPCGASQRGRDAPLCVRTWRKRTDGHFLGGLLLTRSGRRLCGAAAQDNVTRPWSAAARAGRDRSDRNREAININQADSHTLGDERSNRESTG